METISEEEPKEVLESAKTAEEQDAAFGTSLRQTVTAFEKIVNRLPNIEAAVLFCGAMEHVAFEFKKIFMISLEEHMSQNSNTKFTKGAIKRKLLELDHASKSLMSAKYIKPS